MKIENTEEKKEKIENTKTGEKQDNIKQKKKLECTPK